MATEDEAVPTATRNEDNCSLDDAEALTAKFSTASVVDCGAGSSLKSALNEASVGFEIRSKPETVLLNCRCAIISAFVCFKGTVLISSKLSMYLRRTFSMGGRTSSFLSNLFGAEAVALAEATEV